ncbi:uncharacterized protein BDW47DRAFT_99884, partial [Aspergillus candidus]
MLFCFLFFSLFVSPLSSHFPTYEGQTDCLILIPLFVLFFPCHCHCYLILQISVIFTLCCLSIVSLLFRVRCWGLFQWI